MKILVVSQYFWPESFRINDVVRSLQGLGCEVTVLTGAPNYPTGDVFPGFSAWNLGRDRRNLDYELYRVPLAPRRRGRTINLVFNYLSFVVTAALFGPWLLRRKKYDLIFVFGVSPILQAIPAVLIKWLKRSALVIWVQDLWPQSLQVTGYVRNRRILGVVEAVTRWIYQRAELLLGQSEAFLPVLREMSGKVAVRFHPNPGEWADTVLTDTPSLTLKPGFNVLFAGNLGTAQALPTILDAAERLRDRRDVRFVLVGDGSRSDWVRDEVRRRELENVVMPGRFPSSAMPAIFHQASALLVSLNRSEILAQTVPSKVPSYLAAGRPIIASMDGEGGRVVVAAGAGKACAAEDSEALVSAVLELSAMSDAARNEMGARGRAYYDANFNPDMLAARLLSHFRDAIELRRSASVSGR